MIIEKIFKNIWNEFIYGGHLLSLGAPAILWSGAIILEKKASIPLFVAGYTMSQIIYNYNHFKEAKKDALTNPERVEHIEKTKKIFLALFFLYCVIFIVSLTYLDNLKASAVALFITVGGILFTDFGKNLTKKIFGFKTFYTSFFWALLIILAGFYYNIGNNLLTILLFLFVFLRFTLSTAFFDIKDIETDKKEGLKTFAVLFGKIKILKYLHLLNIISFLPIILGAYSNILPLFSLLLCLFYFYSFYYLKKSKDENIRRLSYIMVDGEYFFWPLLLFLWKILF